MINKELGITYCNCTQEGRDIELNNNGTYICLLCHNPLFIHKLWKSRTLNKHTTTLKNNNHALNEGYHGRINNQIDDI